MVLAVDKARAQVVQDMQKVVMEVVGAVHPIMQPHPLRLEALVVRVKMAVTGLVHQLLLIPVLVGVVLAEKVALLPSLALPIMALEVLARLMLT